MNQNPSFGEIVKEQRKELGLTQTELAGRTGCAPVTLRKIEYNALRPSIQMAEHLAVALQIPEEQHLAFIRLARRERDPAPISSLPPAPEEIGQEDLSGRTIKGFKLGQRIGEGNYGAVYRATQSTVERDVAIKIILPEYANQPEFIRRFEAEAQLVARLEHPHIVPLYDYWREPGVAYLVMRYFRGGNLDNLLKQGPLTPDTLLPLLEQICTGLHAAHQAGVIHRDIKPANILLDENGNAYVADFAIAKNFTEINGNLTERNVVIDSPAYIAPEQITAEPVQPQTDVYSLGVMVAGTQQNGLESDSVSKTEAPFRPLYQSKPTPLDVVIGRATAKDPQDRYPDILSLLDDIRQALKPESSIADLANNQRHNTTSPHLLALIDLPDLENPYKGLRAFSEADADDFFGRNTLIQTLLIRMAEEHDLSRFLAVVGPSGSGKSSVVKAGLIPALRQGGLSKSDKWFIVEMIPGLNPLEELEAALLRVAINPPDRLLSQWWENEYGLLRAIERILPTDNDVELVLVIDQFEEIFTLVEDEEIRTHFLNSLLIALIDAASRLRVVITLRADFTDRPLQYVDFGELVQQRTEFVLPLTPDELEEAVIKPTKHAGLALEAGLAATIIDDIGSEPGTLPLLQYALTELFERRQGRLLTLSAYQASGGVLGALARRADELYDSLNEAGQEATRQLFLRLITLGEGVEDTRRRVLRSELSTLQPISPTSLAEGIKGYRNPQQPSPLNISNTPPMVETEENLAEALIQFGRYRLLTFDHDPATRGPTVEVAHEALIREWGRLRTWLDDSRTDIRLQRLLASAASEWIEANQDDSFLLHGARLDQFEGWAEATKIALTEDERAYLEASLVARQHRQTAEVARQQRELETTRKLAETETRRAEERARTAQRLGWLTIGLAVFLVAAIGAAWFALNQRNEARTQTVRAEENFETSERIRLAAQAQIALDNGEGGDLPALLALHSLQYGYSPEADAALLAGLQRGFTRQQYLGHTDDIRLIDLSPDGRNILTASADRTARLWDAQTGEELDRFVGHTAQLNVALFSPDGDYILTGSLDNTARLWDAQTGEEVRQFKEHTGGVWSVGFTPDGQSIVTSDGKMARLWDVQTGEIKQRFVGHTDTIFWLDISLDGNYLATFSGDKTARVWNLQTGQEEGKLIGHTDWVGGGQLSADGRYLVTSSADQTARLWDIRTGQEIRRFVGHTDDLFDARFSHDGRYLLTASYDKTARLWNIASGREVRQFLGHTDFVSTPIFSADDRYLFTGSGDRTARLWEVWPETEPQTLTAFTGGYHSDIYTLSPSSDQKLLVAWTDGTVQVWDVDTNEVVRAIDFKSTTINAQTVSPDNRFVLVGDSDGVVSLAEVETEKIPGQFKGHIGPVWDVTYSPDGQYALSGGEDQTARLWEIETGQEITNFAGHSGPVRAVAFSPDGRLVLTGSDDQTARLWNTQSGDEVRQFGSHAAAVLDVAFSNDGQFVLTGSADNIARRWKLKTDQAPQEYAGHTEQVTHVAFSPDGHYFLTASLDHTVRLWNAETGETRRQLVGHASPILFIDFSPDGKSILTGDARITYRWRLELDEVIDFTCGQLSRDFTPEERTLYKINQATEICAQFEQPIPEVQPTWTAVSPGGVQRSPLALAVEIEFLNESANISMGAPIQDAFVDTGNGQVERPQVLNAETLALPVFRTAVGVELDLFEEPFDTGPYPKGEPLGFTLEEYVAATGRGTYTLRGSRAEVEIMLDNLVADGLYSVWCNILRFDQAIIEEYPCLAPDDSEYIFSADEAGQAEVHMNIATFPPSTQDTVYEIAIAYHSDGQTHGDSIGAHGLNAHGQLFFDFLPPDSPTPASSAATPTPITVEVEFLNDATNSDE